MLQETFRLPRLPEGLCKTDNLPLVSGQCLRFDVTRVKEMMAKEIQTEWIKEEEQVVDCLTKVGASFENLRNLLHE